MSRAKPMLELTVAAGFLFPEASTTGESVHTDTPKPTSDSSRVAILAPPKWSNLLSYITGWVTTIAWQAFCASTTWINSMLLLAIVTNSNPSYEMKDWHAILVFFALVGLSIFVNTFLGRIFPSIEAMVLILHVVGFFVIMIVLAYLAPKTDPSIIFGTFINGGEFSSQTHSVLIGAVSLMFTFSGVDAATHMGKFRITSRAQMYGLTVTQLRKSKTPESSSRGR